VHSHNFSFFAIFVSKIIKIGGNLAKFCMTNTNLHSFFLRHGVVELKGAAVRQRGESS